MIDEAQGIHQLVLLSQTMLEKAVVESWEEVLVLEAERRKMIHLFFLEPLQQVHTVSVAAGIQSILAIDRDIMLLGTQKKLELEQILHDMNQGRKAVKAYIS